ncbi:nuclear transport factor 2 family protein [Telmatobacter bradus]|uniref:nuclear transport factor 2 family protein n=1 Tax=Telmatobacter bradus TaxID=474953 RepID=UPI003B43BD68
MTRTIRRMFLLTGAALLLLLLGFVLGFVASIHTRHTTMPAEANAQLHGGGDAPAEVRAGVLSTLSNLQLAYTRRNPAAAHNFVQANFAPQGDLLLWGIEGSSNDWARGPQDVERFIYFDWLNWGDLQLKIPSAIVNSKDSVAWLTVFGTVGFHGHTRPLLLTAVLERHDQRWLFRQIQFQWAESDSTASDLLHLSTYTSLLRKIVNRVR